MPDVDTKGSEVLPELTRRIAEEFYRLDFEPLLSRLAPGCVWIAPNHATYRGVDDIRSLFAHACTMPPFRLFDASFETLDDIGGNTALVAGGYRLLSDPDSRCLMAASQCVTVLWRHLPGEGWRIAYLHMSNEWSEGDGEGRPFRVGRQTWRYAQEMIRRGISDAGKTLSVPEVGGGMRVLEVSDIMFAQASGKRCTVHLHSGVCEVAWSLAVLVAKLPEVFVRVHRSYAVNRRHVTAFDGSSVTLADGTRIPVPSKRRVHVKRVLERNGEHVPTA